LEVWRSPWFDFFKVEERVKAMQLVWSMMAWMMREQVKEGDGEGEKGGQGQQAQGDVKMSGV
jgi:hypothetical protein